MQGNLHVRFLGEPKGVILSAYPTVWVGKGCRAIAEQTSLDTASADRCFCNDESILRQE